MIVTQKGKNISQVGLISALDLYMELNIYIYQARNTSRGKELVEMGPR
jgi:hypothetical protein